MLRYLQTQVNNLSLNTILITEVLNKKNSKRCYTFSDFIKYNIDITTIRTLFIYYNTD